MKWIKLIARKLNFILRKKMEIPREASNRFKIDFGEINHVLILCDDDGAPTYVIACGGDKNQNFYFEKCSATLMNMLGSGYGDCKHIFSRINDALNRGAESESVLLHIKGLLK